MEHFVGCSVLLEQNLPEGYTKFKLQFVTTNKDLWNNGKYAVFDESFFETISGALIKYKINFMERNELVVKVKEVF